MTVTYSHEVTSAKGTTLIRLLFLRWKGSMMKLVWKDLVIFLTVFYLLQLIYFYGCNDENRKIFEGLVYYAKQDADAIPISFLLGFFVSNVMDRWNQQFNAIPSVNSLAVFVTSTIHGYDEVGRVMRRTIMRYLNLSLVMVFRVLSPRVKKRYPKMEDLIEAGFITESELAVMKSLDKKYPDCSKSWLPICWAASICNRARTEGRIKDDFALKTLIEELNNFRGSCGTLMDFNEFCIPLVYVQVVTIAVYSYFVTTVIAKQPIEPEFNVEYSELQYLDNMPFLITLKFIFYMGWLKVAETMINPFGEDDDDFDVNSMIDSNLIMSYLIVDEMHSQYPDLLKDRYWDALPHQLPDQGKVGSRGDEKTKLTDFFDVTAVRKRSSGKKGLLIPLEEQVMLEQQQREQKQRQQQGMTQSMPTVINVPRSTAENAPANAQSSAVTETAVQKQLRKTRERAVSIKLSEVSSSDDERQ